MKMITKINYTLPDAKYFVRTTYDKLGRDFAIYWKNQFEG